MLMWSWFRCGDSTHVAWFSDGGGGWVCTIGLWQLGILPKGGGVCGLGPCRRITPLVPPAGKLHLLGTDHSGYYY